MPRSSEVIKNAVGAGRTTAQGKAIKAGIHFVLEDLHALLYQEEHTGCDEEHPSREKVRQSDDADDYGIFEWDSDRMGLSPGRSAPRRRHTARRAHRPTGDQIARWCPNTVAPTPRST